METKIIGNKIVEARKKMNLSQAQLAESMFISPQAVGKWERGESMPDITTLIRLAETLGVDLNYFSENFSSKETLTPTSVKKPIELASPKTNKKFAWSWNMSSENWADADFSGLKNLQEKFSSSNMKNCRFANSDLSGLILGSNNIEKCDFSSSDLRDSKVQNSNISASEFKNCSFIDAEFSKSNIQKCDFSESDFSGVDFSRCCIEKSIFDRVMWKFTSFKGSEISDMIFEGNLEDCHFESCSFYNVKFQNAIIQNSFFKYNDRLNKVQFIDCKVDKLTYAFLKNNKANLDGIELLE